MAINTFLWGAVVALTAACTNYGGLMTVRFLLGVAEATISPAFLYITSSWYTRSEIPTRVGIWFSGNSLGGVLASFIAYGLGHIDHPLQPWQWLFIVLGAATFLWGLPLLLLLPDSIPHATFLTPAELRCATHRIALAGTGHTTPAWRPSQALECLSDPKTYFFLALSLLTQIPNGGTQNFGNLVLQGFGFSSLQTTLVTLPASFIAFATILATGRLASAFPNVATHLIVAVVLGPVVGSALIYAEGVPRGAKLAGYYLLATGPGAIPLALSLVGVNYKGATKKMTMTALLFVCYCAGNIAGPHFFVEAEAPRYETAFRAIMVCYALVVGVAAGLRGYLVVENRRRDRVEGEGGGEAVEGDGEGGDELTDWNTRGFRYRM